MIFIETELEGAFIIDVNPLSDSRGFFARAFCQRELQAHGLNFVIAQAAATPNAVLIGTAMSAVATVRKIACRVSASVIVVTKTSVPAENAWTPMTTSGATTTRAVSTSTAASKPRRKAG